MINQESVSKITTKLTEQYGGYHTDEWVLVQLIALMSKPDAKQFRDQDLQSVIDDEDFQQIAVDNLKVLLLGS